MHLLNLLLLGLVGACLGSFSNVILSRLPRGESIISPGSHCMSCHQKIRWFDNIPICSFLYLKGRCRYCKKPIGPRHLLIEILMTALTLALSVRFQLELTGGFWLWLTMFTLLLTLTFLDIDHFWLPDILVLPSISLALLLQLLNFLYPQILRPLQFNLPAPLNALSGLLPAGLLYLVGLLFGYLKKQEVLGLGDVKLLILLGLLLGLEKSMLLLLLASLQGTVIGSLLILVNKKLKHRLSPQASSPASPEVPLTHNTEDTAESWVPPKNAIPFGPFLALATFEIVLLPEIPDYCLHLYEYLSWYMSIN